MDYDVWKKDIELWKLFTDLPKEKVAIAIHLSLSGRARQATSEISINDMKSDNGFKILMDKLDRVFLQDENWRCFNSYLSFENYKRSSDTSISDYLSEFDRRHYKLKECKVELPDAVVACRLLKSCNLSDVHFQLALSTTPKMTFENMRATLKKLFTDCGNKVDVSISSELNSSVNCKVEPVFENEAYYSGSAYRRGYGSSGRSRGAGDRARRGNPVGSDGRVSTCFKCGSKNHWARFCPNNDWRQQSSESHNSNWRQRNSELNSNYYGEDDEVHVTLLAAEENFENKVDTLFGESLGGVILDSGCSRTVCGEMWLASYLETLTSVEKESVKIEQSTSVFKFGDGKRMKSLKRVVLPCVLAGKNVTIRTDVVACNVPLLLSKTSMKRAGMIINLNNDTALIFGKNVKLNVTSIGHYMLPVFHPLSDSRVEEVLLSVDDCDSNKIALKLHRQFAHPPAEKLQKFLRNAGKVDAALMKSIDEVTAACDTCVRYKKPRPRPTVALPMAHSFNETVAMDLKMWKGQYFLVIVDHATRYCVATVIANKNPQTVIKALFVFWITTFGAPRQFLSDNGGEFNNESMRSLGERYGIKILCTAAESPWSNGICERLNCVLGISVQRIIDDTKCSVDIALSWAVSARNALQNCHGFSPNQLVFGYNPVFPSILEGNPPALEDRTSSQIVADNLNAMHSARRDFLRNETDDSP